MSNDQTSRQASEQRSVEPEQTLENQAQMQKDEMPDESAPQAEKQVYVERAKYQRVLAWFLVALVLMGVLLYYAWIAGILK